MKKYLGIFTLILLESFSIGADLAVVMGKPSTKVAKDLVISESDLIGSSREDQSSTWTYSLIKQEKVSKVAAIYILDDDITTTELLWQGLQLGAHRAPVVVTNVGPIDNKVCQFLARFSNTAFVVIAGNDSSPLNSRDYPSCAAGNILFVTAFDQQTDTLMSFANYGSLVRLAAPANDIKILVDGSEELFFGSTSAVTIAAARMANFAKNTALTGQKLIEMFLEEKSIYVPELDRLVQEGRALAY